MNTLTNTPAERNNRETSSAYDYPAKSRRGAAQLVVRFKMNDDPTERTLRAVGRYAWTLLHLWNAGAVGITTIDRPAPRWSEYIFGLRKLGLNILTQYEKHEGAFAGNHGRYILLTPITIVEVVEGGLAHV
jgi:hypothetical protein